MQNIIMVLQIFNNITGFFSNISFYAISNILLVAFIAMRVTSFFKKGFFAILIGVASVCIQFIIALIATAFIIVALSHVNIFDVKQYHIWIILPAILWVAHVLLPISSVLSIFIGEKKVWLLDIASALTLSFVEVIIITSAFNYICDFICESSKTSQIAKRFMGPVPRFIKGAHNITSDANEDDDRESFVSLLCLAVYENKERFHRIFVTSSMSIGARIMLAKTMVQYSSLINNMSRSKAKLKPITMEQAMSFLMVTQDQRNQSSATPTILDANATVSTPYLHNALVDNANSIVAPLAQTPQSAPKEYTQTNVQQYPTQTAPQYVQTDNMQQYPAQSTIQYANPAEVHPTQSTYCTNQPTVQYSQTAATQPVTQYTQPVAAQPQPTGTTSSVMLSQFIRN
jgi:hypothetical protein